MPVTYAVSDTSKAELAVTLQSNLDSWWKLDETSATTIADSSGSGSSSHTAVLIGTDGSTNWTDLGPPVVRQGKFGGALTLDGTNDYGYTSGYKGITGSTRRTLSFGLGSVPTPLIIALLTMVQILLDRDSSYPYLQLGLHFLVMEVQITTFLEEAA